MEKENHVIVIPGLTDEWQLPVYKWATASWEKRGVTPHVIPMNWIQDKHGFAPRLEMLTQLVDDLHTQGSPVSVLGLSAGGSAAGNLFRERKEIIGAMINALGMMKTKGHEAKLEKNRQKTPGWVDSVTLFEKNEPSFTLNERKRILTIRLLIDQVVPVDTVPIEGATNIEIPWFEHISGGALVMTVYSRLILNFIATHSNQQ